MQIRKLHSLGILWRSLGNLEKWISTGKSTFWEGHDGGFTWFLSLGKFCRRVLSLPASVCLFVCPSVSLKVDAYPQDNLSSIWARISIFTQNAYLGPYWKWAWLTLTFKVILDSKQVNFELLSMITRQGFKLGSPFYTECVSWAPSVPYWKWSWLTLPFKVILDLNGSIFANLSLSRDNSSTLTLKNKVNWHHFH